jgi:hypothetical protein
MGFFHSNQSQPELAEEGAHRRKSSVSDLQAKVYAKWASSGSTRSRKNSSSSLSSQQQQAVEQQSKSTFVALFAY